MQINRGDACSCCSANCFLSCARKRDFSSIYILCVGCDGAVRPSVTPPAPRSAGGIGTGPVRGVRALEAGRPDEGAEPKPRSASRLSRRLPADNEQR